MRAPGIFVAAIFVAAIGVAAIGVAAEAAPSVTFTHDIAPIMFTRCASCHRPGAVAFSLLTYDEVRPRARQIALATKSRSMPPWKPEPGHGDFQGVRRLSDAEIDTIQRWVADGAHQGDRAALPPVPTWTSGWRLGDPDLVVSMPQAFTVPASGNDVYRIFVIPIPLNAKRYVKAWEFRPGNPRVVHHATMQIDASGLSKRIDTSGGEPGYEGLVPPTVRTPDGFFLDWGPGHTPFRAAAGIAWPLQPGSDLVLMLHLRPDGQREPVQASVGFYLTDEPPTHVPVMMRLNREDLDVPPGDSHYMVEDSFTVPVDLDVYTVQPHAHYLAREVEGFARFPDGRMESLISIRNWDFDWQDVYQYVHPLFLPRGTTVVMRWRYDNSDGNRRNPNQPPRRVTYGQRTSDEMSELWFQVVPRRPADRDPLAAGIRSKVLPEEIKGLEMMLADQPDNVALHDDAALLYAEAGNLERSAAHFAASARLRPASPAAHFNLGTALLARGMRDEAARQFRDALDLDPGYARAHRSLGLLFQQQGRLDEAVREYGEALRGDSGDPEAHYSLGLVLASQHTDAEAVDHFQRSLDARPDWPPAMVALAWVRATSASDALRRPADAVRLAERAVQLTQSRDIAALDTLGAALAASGQFERAVSAASAAAALATASDHPAAGAIRDRLAGYRRGIAYREP
jgi:tetratricopeptide (TPR) repeat protein/mono/diheme cytochrome c family protein